MKSVHLDLIKTAGSALGTPVSMFYLAAAIGGGLLLIGSFALIGDLAFAVAIGLLAYAAAVLIAGRSLSANYPHARLGFCNLATLGRLIIVGILFAALLAGLAPSWATFVLAVTALGLDGVDGWLARQQGLASAFGARFDVEVDAAFALILAIFAALNGAAGIYVVLLGLPYYVFGLAKIFAPWLNQPLPDRFSRRAVCVFQITALIGLQLPVFASGRLDVIVGAVTAALLWSFGRDILWLWRKAQ